MSQKLGVLLAVVVLAIPVLIAAGAASVVSALAGSNPSGNMCLPDSAAGQAVPGYTPEQALNAGTIIAVGRRLGIPADGWVIALATALQESGLRNLDYGDRDSLGLFQQRPSQGWGSPDQIRDPTYAATQFYRHLGTIPGWQTMPLTEAAQAVQRSGFPDAYARHEPDARRFVAALTGITCTATPPGRPRTTWTPQPATEPDPTSTGRITPRTLSLVHTLQRHNLTGDGLGCHAHRPANPNSDHPRGRACDIMLNPHHPTAVTHGWRIAHWLTAHQPQLGVRYLIWHGKYWSAHQPHWTTYTSTSYGCPDPANLTGCHYDHIHVSMY